MRLILIYGAPGTGKYTVASELSTLTNYTLFHNHAVLNIVSDIFEFDHPKRRPLEKKIRLQILKEAVKENINLIITGVIIKDKLDFYKKIIRMVEESGGECFLVQLITSQNIMEKRISSESRMKMKKITTIETLNEWLDKYPESTHKFDYKNQMSVDTGKVSPLEAAKKITNSFKLT